MVNYRYSTLSVFKYLGLDFGTGSAVPQYQDLTFKIDLPTKKNWQIFSLGNWRIKQSGIITKSTIKRQ